MATQQITATLSYSDGGTDDVTSTATWSSNDEAVATVSTSGLVTAVGEGTCVVTATHSGFSADADITVPAPAPEALTVDPADATVELG